MKKHYLILVITLVTTSIFSQTPSFEWAKVNYGGNNDEATEIAVDNDGNVIEVGSFRSQNPIFNLQGNLVELSPGTPGLIATNSDSYIAKYNASGDFLWYKRTVGSSVENVQSVTTDGNNNIYVCGNYYSPVTSIFGTSAPSPIYTTLTSGVRRAFIMKMDPLGNTVWFKALDVNYLINNAYFQFISIKVDTNGNVYAAAEFTGNSISIDNISIDLVFGDVTQYRSDTCIFKLDSDGNAIWIKGIQGTENEDISKIDTDNSGNIYFSGLTLSTQLLIGSSSYPTGNISIPDNKSYTAKLDSNGNLVWLDFNSYGNDGSNRFLINDTAVDSQGNVYFVGSTRGGVIGMAGTHAITFGATTVNVSYVPDESRAYVLAICKYSSNGQKQWMKTTDYAPNLYITATAIDIDSTDAIYIAGEYSKPTFLNNFALQNADYISLSSASTSEPYKGFVTRMNTNGDFIWAKTISPTFKMRVADMEVSENGNAYFAGKFRQQNSGIMFDQVFVTGFSNGGLFDDAFIAKLPTTNLSTNNNLQDKALAVFPNPANKFITINSKNNTLKMLEIYEVNGKLVETHKQHLNNTVSIENLENGIYFIKAYLNTGEVFTEKFIKH